ncbi:MAG: hypothetical protein ACR2PB_10535 [Desulfocapsaceae bacterium]
MEWVKKTAGDDLFLEIINIRNQAIHLLISQHGLDMGQVMRLTLGDIDLTVKMIFIKPDGESDRRYLTLTNKTADALADYLRVRSPSAENKLFLLEQNLERSNALHQTIGQQIFLN